MRKPKRRFTVSVETLEGRLLMSAAPQFTVKDLGINITAESINNLGEVIGDVPGNTRPHVAVYNPNENNWNTLNLNLGEQMSLGRDINDHGQVAGIALDSTGAAYGFLYSNSVSTRIQNTFYPTKTIEALSVNNAGYVVGRYWTNNTERAFLYDGTIHDIGDLGANSAIAESINDSNQITGMSHNGTYGHAFFYDGSMHDLGALNGQFSVGYSINQYGQVAGVYTDPNGIARGFVSDPNGGTLHDVDLPSNATGEELHSINNRGQAVGWAMTGDNYEANYAIYYDGTTTRNLNDIIQSNPGFTIVDAKTINDNGQIAAIGYDSSKYIHALLLTPAPTAPTITWSNPTDIVYGTPITSTQLNATADVPGTFTYNIAQGTVLHAGAAQKLEATFTPTDTSLYTTATAEAFLNVTPAPLTVTANNVTHIYGQPMPPLTGTITGLVNGDTDVATYSTTATTYSPTGTYPITPALTDSNYNVTLVNGTLTQAPVRLFVESYYLARYPNVATIVASGRYPSAYAYFKAVGVYMGDMATPDWTPTIEQAYLTANPDVARAVTSGTLKSGYEHFFLYGQYQNRAGAPPLT